MPIASEAQISTQADQAASDVNEVLGEIVKQCPQPPTTTETIVFLDWDDTLLCSSVLSGAGIGLNTDLSTLPQADELLRQLDELSTLIIKVLNKARTYGEVHIVTNGETGWVQMSANNFVPRVVPHLEHVHILSARSTFEKKYPDNPMQWKFHAFKRCLADLYAQNCFKNVLSFGDSHAEREAIRAVTKNLPYTRTKSIKFAERPSIEQLQRQLELVSKCFEYISDHEENLDLCMSLSQQPNPPEGDAQVVA